MGAVGAQKDIEYSGSGLSIISFNGSTGDTRQNLDSSEIILRNTSGSPITIRKFQLRGTPLRELKQLRVEHIDATVSDEWDEVEREIPGKYATTEAMAKQIVRRWVDFGKVARKEYEATVDFTPHLQIGALVTFNPNTDVNLTCFVESYQHMSAGPHTKTRTRVHLVERVDFSATGAGSTQTVSDGPGGIMGTSIVVGSSTYDGPCDFKCPGADDDDVINAALAEGAAQGRNHILLSDGTYKITDTIDVGSSTTGQVLEAMGENTIIEVGADVIAIGITPNGGTIRSIRFTLKGGVTLTNPNIAAADGPDSLIDRCRFDATNDQQIYADTCTNLTIRDCTFDAPGNTSDDSIAGIVVDGCTTVNITGCRFVDPERWCIRIVDSTGVQITACDVTGSGTSPSFCSVSESTGETKNIHVSTCTMHDITAAASARFFYANSGSSIDVSNNSISNVELTSDDVNNAAAIIMAFGIDDLNIGGNIIENVQSYGRTTYQNDKAIRLEDPTTDKTTVSNNRISNVTGYGVKIDATAGNFHVNNNAVSECGQLLDRCGCESTTPPAPRGETANTLSNCTFARDSAQKRGGTYSYKFTKTIAAGTAAYAALCDSESTTDLHGLLPGRTYTFSAWVYIPSGGIAYNEIRLILYDYTSGAWSLVSKYAVNTYDAWQQITVTHTLPAAATGFRLRIYVDTTAAINEYFYVDQVRLWNAAYANEHGDCFTSSATVQQSGNTWQTPVVTSTEWGEPHELIATLVDTDPTSTSDQTVTVADAPNGAKGIAGYASVQSVTTAGRALSIKDSAGNIWQPIRNPTTAIKGYSWFEVPLDSSKQFLYAVDNADVSQVLIEVREVFL